MRHPVHSPLPRGHPAPNPHARCPSLSRRQGPRSPQARLHSPQHRLRPEMPDFPMHSEREVMHRGTESRPPGTQELARSPAPRLLLIAALCFPSSPTVQRRGLGDHAVARVGFLREHPLPTTRLRRRCVARAATLNPTRQAGHRAPASPTSPPRRPTSPPAGPTSLPAASSSARNARLPDAFRARSDA